MNIRRLIFIVLLSGTAAPASLVAQVAERTRAGEPVENESEAPGYHLRRIWTTQDGLPQNSVTAITQTRDGFLWLGTYGGLARFDGVTFTTFSTVNTPELQSNRIQALLEGPDGRLWIGTESGGVTCYHHRRFWHYGADSEAPGGTVQSIVRAADGSIWFGGDGVSRFAIESFEPIRSPHLAKIGRVSALAADPDGAVWAAGTGIVRIEGGECRPLAGDVESSYLSTSFIAASPAMGVFGRTGRGFAVMRGDRLDVLQDDGQLDRRRIFTALADAKGNQLLATEAGLFRVSVDGSRLHVAAHVGHGEVQPGVRAVWPDQEGSLWLGLQPGGLAQYVPSAFTTVAPPDVGDRGWWRSFCDDGHGGLWLADGQSESLWRWFPGRSHAARAPPELPRIPGAKSLLRDPDGTLWIRHPDGLTSVRDGRVVDHVRPDPRGVEPGQWFFQDPAGAVWFGSGNALVRFDGSRFCEYTAAHGLPSDEMPQVFACGPGGDLWFSGGRTVCRLHDERITVFSQDQGVPRGSVRAICQASDGSLWIGTYGGGLAVLTGGRFVPVTSQHGLYDDSVSHIADDRAGHLWINSNRGAFRAGLEALHAVVRGKSKTLTCRALGTPESYGSGGARTSDERFVVPTIQGLAVIDPLKVQRPNWPPPVVLLDVIAGGQHCDPGQAIVVAPGGREVEFQFTGLTFLDPENTRFEYRLIGLDERWQDAGHQRSVRYGRLPPGDYRFEVRAVDSSGVRSAASVAAEIELRPFFYETRWFLGGMLVLLFGTVIAIYELRQYSGKRRRRELEREIIRRTEAEAMLRDLAGRLIGAQEAERARIARELHDDLSQRLALLAIDLQIAAGEAPPEVPESWSSEFLRLADNVKDISGSVHALAYELHPSMLDQVGLFAAIQSLCATVSARGPAVSFRADGAQPLDLPAPVTLCLFRVVQEALRNILRHSGADRAEVEALILPEAVRLSIVDNGCGFDPKASTAARGLGLISMRERVRLLDGRIEIRSRPGAGTGIEVTVPRGSGGGRG